MRVVVALVAAFALVALAPAAAAPAPEPPASLVPPAAVSPGASAFVAFEAVRVLLPDGSLAPLAPVD